MRPVLLAAAALRSAFTEGKSLSGQRGTSAVGNFSPGLVPGSSPPAGALLIELPGPRGACWISSSCSLRCRVWSCLSFAGAGSPGARGRRRGRGCDLARAT